MPTTAIIAVVVSSGGIDMFDKNECINTIKSTALDIFTETKSGMNTDLVRNKIQLIQIQLNRLDEIEAIGRYNEQKR